MNASKFGIFAVTVIALAVVAHLTIASMPTPRLVGLATVTKIESGMGVSEANRLTGMNITLEGLADPSFDCPVGVDSFPFKEGDKVWVFQEDDHLTRTQPKLTKAQLDQSNLAIFFPKGLASVTCYRDNKVVADSGDSSQ